MERIVVYSANKWMTEWMIYSTEFSTIITINIKFYKHKVIQKRETSTKQT